MELTSTNKDFIKECHISLCIKEKNVEVGNCVISLKEACSFKPFFFKIPLYSKGITAGTIEGSIRVVWPQAESLEGTGKLKSGFLLKQGEKVKSWKRRWFILYQNGLLCYFNSPKDKNPIKSFNIKGLAVSSNTTSGKQNCITIATKKRDLIFCADDESDRNQWMEALLSIN